MSEAPRRPAPALRDIGDAAAAVRRAGGRLTAARRSVIEALFRANGPVSAEQIADGLGGRVPRTDPTSVYRNLEWLERIGVVRHLHLGHGPGLYVLARDAGPAYLVCERCGRVATLEAGAVDRARAAIRRASGYEAQFDHFPIHGFCPGCAGDRGSGAAARGPRGLPARAGSR